MKQTPPRFIRPQRPLILLSQHHAESNIITNSKLTASPLDSSAASKYLYMIREPDINGDKANDLKQYLSPPPLGLIVLSVCSVVFVHGLIPREPILRGLTWIHENGN